MLSHYLKLTQIYNGLTKKPTSTKTKYFNTFLNFRKRAHISIKNRLPPDRQLYNE